MQHCASIRTWIGRSSGIPKGHDSFHIGTQRLEFPTAACAISHLRAYCFCPIRGAEVYCCLSFDCPMAGLRPWMTVIGCARHLVAGRLLKATVAQECMSVLRNS